MDEKDFLEQYHRDIPSLSAWGSYVKWYVENGIRQILASSETADTFLKTPTTPRIKSDNSIIEKAFYRNKGYGDPYKDITDKVGLRFVVLTTDDINTVCGIIDEAEGFDTTKDRDFESERERHPEHFTYQSIHYVVRNKAEIQYDGHIITPHTPCEVQIRTLLQHAYSELTHDILYKAKTVAQPKVKRLIARSCALIETTDAIFSEASMAFNQTRTNILEIDSFLTRLYEELVGFVQPTRLNEIIYDDLVPLLHLPLLAEIETFSREFHVARHVSHRLESKLLYRQPVIFLLYYIAYRQRAALQGSAILTERELQPIYNDLGFSVRP